MIPNKYTVETGLEVWCDRGMRVRPFLKVELLAETE